MDKLSRPTSAQDSAASEHERDDSLPTYSETTYAPSTSAEHAPTEDLFSEAGDQAPTEERPAYMSDLNPEARKKLEDELRRSGTSSQDYGFLDEGPPTECLPSFAETEMGERPQYSINRNGDVVSHDPRLNSNPAFLLRFLRQHASSPPMFTVSMRGSHIEWKEQSNWHKNSDGSYREHRHRGLGSARGAGGGGMRGYLYAVGDWEAVHRGGAFKSCAKTEAELEKTTGTIRIPDEEQQVGEELDPAMQSPAASWKTAGVRSRRHLVRGKEDREKRGLPSFVDPDLLDESEDAEVTRWLLSHFVDLLEVHASNPPKPVDLDSWPTAWRRAQAERHENDQRVEQIVAEYCASQALAKELCVSRSELYGWDLSQLEMALRSYIGRSYGGTISISFTVTPSTIIIRPDNWVSNVFELPVLAKILLWMCFAYPVLLIYDAMFGQKWRNIRCAFPLTRWRRVPVPTSQPSSSCGAPNMTGEQAQSIVSELQRGSSTPCVHPPRMTELSWPNGGPWLYLCGTLEGEWLKQWEGAITNAVRSGSRQRTLTAEDRDQVEVQHRDQLSLLRGYDA
ncbi:hypothetical protein OIV83_004421 [Microbotryomycetes sp. JL201]|nr:hypothetical protein OIV83_004421 [Microbotryomycetes sp. JL201]